MIIENIDWQITSICNRECSYCFGPKELDSLSIEQVYMIIDILYTYGVKQIGLTGGEPLAHPNITQIINYIYNLGINIYLSTNCDYYPYYSTLIKEKISILGVPIDGSISNLHDKQRGSKSFEAVKYTIEDISNSETITKLKIGTVLTKYNYLDIANIEKMIAPFSSKILYWKIYELITYPKNASKVKNLILNYNIQEKLGVYLEKDKIVLDTKLKRNRSYFFVKPNGDVFVPILTNEDSEERIIGNILSDDKDMLISNFETLVNFNGYNKSYRYMKGRI